ncbi:hypothetical protein C8Q73DRAFT_249089 [Cubamyces lactineus]|nr:hypothetical protein C8Q73DRAFT_249089 [Cubamyces lactineus]
MISPLHLPYIFSPLSFRPSSLTTTCPLTRTAYSLCLGSSYVRTYISPVRHDIHPRHPLASQPDSNLISLSLSPLPFDIGGSPVYPPLIISPFGSLDIFRPHPRQIPPTPLPYVRTSLHAARIHVRRGLLIVGICLMMDYTAPLQQLCMTSCTCSLSSPGKSVS